MDPSTTRTWWRAVREDRVRLPAPRDVLILFATIAVAIGAAVVALWVGGRPDVAAVGAADAMAPVSAAGFAVAGIGFVLIALPRRRAAVVAGLVAASTALASIVAYVAGAEPALRSSDLLGLPGALGPVAPVPALAILVFGIAIAWVAGSVPFLTSGTALVACAAVTVAIGCVALIAYVAGAETVFSMPTPLRVSAVGATELVLLGLSLSLALRVAPGVPRVRGALLPLPVAVGTLTGMLLLSSVAQSAFERAGSAESAIAVVLSGEATVIVALVVTTGVAGAARLALIAQDRREALAESEARLRAIVESSPDGIAISDRNGLLVEWNPAMERATRRPRASVLGRLMWEVQASASVSGPSDELAARIRDTMLAALRGERGIWDDRTYVTEIVRGDGTRGWLETRPFLVPAESALGLGGVARDITDRVAMERALSDSRERLRRFLEASPIAVCTATSDGTLTYANPALCSLLGYEPAELLGRDGLVLLPPDDRGAGIARGAGVGPGNLGPFRQTLIRKDGSPVETEIVATYARTAGGDVEVGAFVTDLTDVLRDQEERRLLDARLNQTQRLESMTVLAGGVAHDFNNLLVGMLGNASLLLDELPATDARRETVEQIELAARRAADLSRQLLAYSGRAAVNVRPVDVAGLVRDMSGLLEVSAGRRVQIDYRVAEDTPRVMGDVTQLRQVVLNLVLNAAEAIDGAGAVTISTGRCRASRALLAAAVLPGVEEGDVAFLEVADTGAGMDETTREHLFDPFFTTKATGRGLGLASVLGIVRGHHGTIRVESAPGTGTRILVLLPVAHAAAAQAASDGASRAGAVPEPVPAAEGSPRDGGACEPGPAAAPSLVLVVDDEDAVRRVAARMLERGGFRVLEACDGEEALRVFREHGPGVGAVLLDLTMPRMDGAEALRELRAIDPDVPVVISSGFSRSDTSAQLSGERVEAYVEKPYAVDALLSAVTGVARAAAAQ